MNEDPNKTGRRNTGHWNAGDRNTGHFNTGVGNTGDFNTGSRNAGSRNAGRRNTGVGNTGHWNAGDRNTGHFNTGVGNTGRRNTGHWNAGDRNTGDFNIGVGNTGFFCVSTPGPMFFDLPCGLSWDEASRAIPYIEMPVATKWVPSDEMSKEQKVAHPSHATTGGFLQAIDMPIRESFPIAWSKLSQSERLKWKSLPNFDAEKFERITGVDVRADEPKSVTIRTPDGNTVRVLGEIISTT